MTLTIVIKVETSTSFRSREDVKQMRQLQSDPDVRSIRVAGWSVKVVNAMSAVRVLIADDHPMIRMGMEALFRAEPDIEPLISCADGKTALNAIRTLQPDIAFLDVYLPKMSGFDVLKATLAEGLSTAVVIVSSTFDAPHLERAVALGAAGILLKGAEPSEFLGCFRSIRAGENWISSSLLRRISDPDPIISGRVYLNGLTAREREILELVREGLTNKEIGNRLGVSEGTVKIHLHNMYRKTAVSNRTSLVALRAPPLNVR